MGWALPRVGGGGAARGPQRHTAWRARGPTTDPTISTVRLLYSTCPLRLATLMCTAAVLPCRYKVFWYVTIVAALANAFIEPYKLAFTNDIHFG